MKLGKVHILYTTLYSMIIICTITTDSTAKSAKFQTPDKFYAIQEYDQLKGLEIDLKCRKCRKSKQFGIIKQKIQQMSPYFILYNLNDTVISYARGRYMPMSIQFQVFDSFNNKIGKIVQQPSQNWFTFNQFYIIYDGNDQIIGKIQQSWRFIKTYIQVRNNNDKILTDMNKFNLQPAIWKGRFHSKKKVNRILSIFTLAFLTLRKIEKPEPTLFMEFIQIIKNMWNTNNQQQQQNMAVQPQPQPHSRFPFSSISPSTYSCTTIPILLFLTVTLLLPQPIQSSPSPILISTYDKLQATQKILTVGMDLYLESYGQQIGIIKQKMLSLSTRFDLEDSRGNVLCHIEQKFWTFWNQYQVYNNQRVKIGKIVQQRLKQMFTFWNLFSVFDEQNNFVAEVRIQKLLLKTHIQVQNNFNYLQAKMVESSFFNHKWEINFYQNSVDRRLLIFLPAIVSKSQREAQEQDQ